MTHARFLALFAFVWGLLFLGSAQAQVYDHPGLGLKVPETSCYTYRTGVRFAITNSSSIPIIESNNDSQYDSFYASLTTPGTGAPANNSVCNFAVPADTAEVKLLAIQRPGSQQAMQQWANCPNLPQWMQNIFCPGGANPMTTPASINFTGEYHNYETGNPINPNDFTLYKQTQYALNPVVLTSNSNGIVDFSNITPVDDQVLPPPNLPTGRPWQYRNQRIGMNNGSNGNIQIATAGSVFYVNIRKGAIQSLPGNFNLNSPTTSCSGNSPRVTLNWGSSQSATSYAVYRNNVALSLNVTSPWTDNSVASGSHTYKIRAQNSVGYTESNSQLVNVPTCQPQPVLSSVAINPPFATVITNNIVQFSANCRDQNGANFNGASVLWGAQRGSINQSGLYTAPATAGSDTVTAQCAAVGQNPVTGAAPVTVKGGQITGDIFAEGDVSNLNIDPDSVVSSNGSVTVTGTNNTIQQYDSNASQQADTVIQKLINEKANVLGAGSSASCTNSNSGNYTLNSVFNLNPKQAGNPSDSEENAANPEGGVWFVRHNLIMRGATFKGKGTIIVCGDVNLISPSNEKTIAYQDGGTGDDLVGLISLNGNIDLRNYDNLVGAYYAPNGTIDVGQGSSSLGLYIGENITLQAADVTVDYDGRITNGPPPGFSKSFVPSLSEVAP
ncbi:hypothetical protein HYW32_03275 [Candidatus Berkelbacteria bacterium]|nr:hypothetical protein [Candidatus Berkelbacteria bacterium]